MALKNSSKVKLNQAEQGPRMEKISEPQFSDHRT